MSISNPKKQMVVDSLNALHKARTKAMFKLKAIRQDKNRIKSEEEKVLRGLMSLEQKIFWEINNHSKLLNE